MNVGLYQAASAMHAAARWQETVANNLSSGAIPGFKKQDATFESVQAGLTGGGADKSGAQFYMPGMISATNFTHGEVLPTMIPTDVALQGEGFFELMRPDGSLVYSRDGSFRVTTQGTLVNKQGFVVMGDSGPIELDPKKLTAVQISDSGEVKQGADVKDTLRVVDFGNPNKLINIGAGCFSANDPATNPFPTKEVSVMQGFIESSNMSPVAEMAQLVTAMRVFESNQRVMQMQDERMAKAISELSGTA